MQIQISPDRESTRKIKLRSNFSNHLVILWSEKLTDEYDSVSTLKKIVEWIILKIEFVPQMWTKVVKGIFEYNPAKTRAKVIQADPLWRIKRSMVIDRIRIFEPLRNLADIL